jgi:hypothetical protein
MRSRPTDPQYPNFFSSKTKGETSNVTKMSLGLEEAAPPTMTVPVWVPGVNPAPLTLTVSVADAPAASVPDGALTPIHDSDGVAIQFSVPSPVLETTTACPAGEPPVIALNVSAVALTPTLAAEFTFSVTATVCGLFDAPASLTVTSPR